MHQFMRCLALGGYPVGMYCDADPGTVKDWEWSTMREMHRHVLKLVREHRARARNALKAHKAVYGV